MDPSSARNSFPQDYLFIVKTQPCFMPSKKILHPVVFELQMGNPYCLGINSTGY